MAAPVAAFSADQVSVVVGTEIFLTDESTNTPDTRLREVSADRWLNRTPMGTTQNNSIIPQSPGSLSIRLTATNIDGSDDETKIDYITVTLPVPAADFIADTTTWFSSLAVQFTDQSTNTPTSWLWNLGVTLTTRDISAATQSGIYFWNDLSSWGIWSFAKMQYNADGTELMVVYLAWGPLDRRVEWYALSTPYDISSSSGISDHTIILWSLSDFGKTWYINRTGTQLYMFEVAWWQWNHYVVDKVAWTFVLTSVNAVIWEIYWMNDAGTLLISNTGAFTLSTPRDISTATLTDPAGLSPFTNGSVSYDGMYLRVCSGTQIVQLNFGTAWTPSTITIPGLSYDVSGRGSGISLDWVWPGQTSGTINALVMDYIGLWFLNQTLDIPFGSVTSTDQNPLYTYAEGIYTVSLTATNISGSDTETKVDYITVSTPVVPPVAEFTVDNVTPVAWTQIHFTDLSLNTPTSRLWDFGIPGETSTAQNPDYTYNTPGTYTVTLTATNAGGPDTMVKTDYITVSAVPPTGNADYVRRCKSIYTSTYNKRKEMFNPYQN